jgi:large subunit ribosomal protein L25
MEKITLNAETREATGKGNARSLRREGLIPAVIYRTGVASSLTINTKEIVQLFKKAEGNLSLLSLKFKDNSSKLAIVKNYLRHPVSGDLLHVDFQEVAADEEITLFVGITLTGEPIGVKRDSGILEQQMHQVEIKCVPDNIPAHIDLNIEEIEAGSSLHVSDLVAPEGVEIMSTAKDVVAAVTIPAVVEEPTAEGEEAEEGAEAAEGTEEETEEKKEE